MTLFQQVTGRQVTGSRFRQPIALLLILLLLPHPAMGYAVLSHEEVIDLSWDHNIVPLLLSRYPASTPEDLRKAHAYAYGGSIIQDIGYYPHGKHFFSDLVHYVRTGDFVCNLLREASDLDEYAFALGALAHYASDTYGHPAVNAATAVEYPKLRRKFGDKVLYDQDPAAHLQTEFGFDVVEVAQRRYAPSAYHDFIGFEVSKPLLERAFRDTYGFEVNQIMPEEDRAIGSYRHVVSQLMPKVTRVAVAKYGKQMEQAQPGYAKSKFLYRISRADYEKSWGTDYDKPGFQANFIVFLLRILPKVGPLKDLSLRPPDPATQKAFLAGMDKVGDEYNNSLRALQAAPPYTEKLDLPNRDLDTGEMTRPGEYKLADETYAKLLDHIVAHPETPIPGPLRESVLNFFAPGQHNYVMDDPKQWSLVEADLVLLRKAKLEVIKVSNQSTAQQQPDVPKPARSVSQ